MSDDIVKRLREMERVQSQWDCRPEPRWKEAADEIERLRAEVDRLNRINRRELLISDARCAEIELLRALITAWVDASDADNEMWQSDPSIADRAVTSATMRTATLVLRKAVGR